MTEKPSEVDQLADELANIPAGEFWRASARELGGTINEIKKEADAQRRRARGNHSIHLALLVITVLLGVVAPILVTYQASPDSSTALQVLAVIVTALTSVAATLQAALRLHERYRRATLTALDLDNLLAQALAELQNVRTDEMDPFSELNVGTRRELNRILRTDIEAEVTTVVKSDATAKSGKTAQSGQPQRKSPV